MQRAEGEESEDLKFEEALAKLEELSGSLKQELPLEDSLKLFESGVAWPGCAARNWMKLRVRFRSSQRRWEPTGEEFAVEEDACAERTFGRKGQKIKLS